MVTEKEKMIAGKAYYPGDAQLLADRAAAKQILYEYNRLSPSHAKQREAYIRELLAQTGDSFVIEQPFYCDYGYNIKIGENFFSNMNCVILDEALVTIGDNVLFAPNVSLYTAGHPLDVERRVAGIEYARPITIGNNVWVGGSVTILPGVSIGDNSVIGGGSVVTKDIPANVLAVGSPCKVLREINDADKIDNFERLR